MTYYPTLTEDLARAKKILDEGKPRGEELALVDIFNSGGGGTIYGKDTYAAYKLLESFVEEIERLWKALGVTNQKDALAAITGLKALVKFTEGYVEDAD